MRIHGKIRTISGWLPGAVLCILIYFIPVAECFSKPIRSFLPGDFRADSQRILDTIIKLQNFGTRFAGTAGSDSAAFYLKSRMEDLGVPTSLDTVVYLSGSWKRTFNVKGTLSGSGATAEKIILGAHFDSISRSSYVDSLSPAPGADDNASGCAAVLEIASNLRGRSFKKSIEFVFFGGEEIGRRGSIQFASSARSRGDRISAMLSLDAVGYEAGPVWDIDIIYNAQSNSLARACIDAFIGTGQRIVPISCPNPFWMQSDQFSFWEEGYPAVHLYEGQRDANPYFHTAGDSAGGINLDYLGAVVDAVSSLAADMAVMSTAPTAVTLKKSFPNPFFETVALSLFIHFPTKITADVYDVSGRLVKTIYTGRLPPGENKLYWDGRTQSGHQASAGVYFIRLSTPFNAAGAKVTLVR